MFNSSELLKVELSTLQENTIPDLSEKKKKKKIFKCQSSIRTTIMAVTLYLSEAFGYFNGKYFENISWKRADHFHKSMEGVVFFSRNIV